MKQIKEKNKKSLEIIQIYPSSFFFVQLWNNQKLKFYLNILSTKAKKKEKRKTQNKTNGKLNFLSNNFIHLFIYLFSLLHTIRIFFHINSKRRNAITFVENFWKSQFFPFNHFSKISRHTESNRKSDAIQFTLRSSCPKKLKCAKFYEKFLKICYL